MHSILYSSHRALAWFLFTKWLVNKQQGNFTIHFHQNMVHSRTESRVRKKKKKKTHPKHGVYIQFHELITKHKCNYCNIRRYRLWKYTHTFVFLYKKENNEQKRTEKNHDHQPTSQTEQKKTNFNKHYH